MVLLPFYKHWRSNECGSKGGSNKHAWEPLGAGSKNKHGAMVLLIGGRASVVQNVAQKVVQKSMPGDRGVQVRKQVRRYVSAAFYLHWRSSPCGSKVFQTIFQKSTPGSPWAAVLFTLAVEPVWLKTFFKRFSIRAHQHIPGLLFYRQWRINGGRACVVRKVVENSMLGDPWVQVQSQVWRYGSATGV